MKTPILIALAAVAALAATANAQFVADDDYGVQLKNAPDFGPLLRAPDAFAPRRDGGSVQVDKKDRIQLGLFPDASESFPHFDQNQPAGTRLKTSKSNFAIEIVRQDTGQALRQLAKVLGVRIVIDPEIKFLPATTRSFIFNAVKDDAFDDVSEALIRGEAIEKWKSAAGTYFFAAKPIVTNGPTNYFQMPDGTWQRFDLLPPSKDLRVVPPPFDGVPFLSERDRTLPRIAPDFTWPKNFGRLQPLPNGEKREFNGQPFYNMPLPVPGKPGEPSSGFHVLPLPQRGPVK